MRIITFLAPVLASLLLTSCEQSNERDAQIQKLDRQVAELREDVSALSTLRSKMKELETENSAIRSILVAHKLGEQALATAKFSLSSGALDDPFLGEKDADVIVMTFFDFSCRPCRAFYRSTLPKLKAEFIDNKRIRFILRDFPIRSKPHSTAASVFANCVGEQGKYWEGFDALMKLPAEVDTGNFEALAAGIAGLDNDKLKKCRESGKFQREIDADFADGATLGAKGAPGFFLGRRVKDRHFEGIFLRGAQPFPVFHQQLQKLLKAPQ